MVTTTKKLPVEEIIQKTITAQRIADFRRPKDAFRATEGRIQALPILAKRIARMQGQIKEMDEPRSSLRSMSIVRFQRSSYRVEPEEMLDAIIEDLKAKIAADEHEIATVQWAMEPFKGDLFFPTVIGRYIDRCDDESIAADLGCSTNQVWKQRTRIVRDISIMLYGADAL
jgi:hypothetical protein